MKNSYYMHDGPESFWIELMGAFSAEDAKRLEQDWRTASSVVKGRALVVDLTCATSVDPTARELLAGWFREGAQLVAKSLKARSLAESITGHSYAPPVQSRSPHRVSKPPRNWIALTVLVAVLFPMRVYAETSLVVPPAFARSLAFARYIASLDQRDAFTESGSVAMEVEASLPKVGRQAKLIAVRETELSERTGYRVLAVEGDSTVKREVIARYLSAREQADALPLSSVLVTPANYKFRYAGSIATGDRLIYVYEIHPRKKRVGLVKGQLWIDAVTGLAVRQAGHLVKRPSPFVRRIDLVRDTELRDGIPVTRITHLNVDVRLFGRAELTITERPLTSQEEVTQQVIADRGRP